MREADGSNGEELRSEETLDVSPLIPRSFSLGAAAKDGLPVASLDPTRSRMKALRDGERGAGCTGSNGERGVCAGDGVGSGARLRQFLCTGIEKLWAGVKAHCGAPAHVGEPFDPRHVRVVLQPMVQREPHLLKCRNPEGRRLLREMQVVWDGEPLALELPELAAGPLCGRARGNLE